MTATEEYALDLVGRNVAERKAAHKSPEVATLNEALTESRAEITEALEKRVDQEIRQHQQKQSGDVTPKTFSPSLFDA